MKKILALLIVLFLVPLTASAQDFCEGNFDYDDDQDGSDAVQFKEDFGRMSYDNPCPPDGPAPVPKTGQTRSETMGDDGDLEKGVAWPNPRFTDNLDGTVTDNLTGLIWLKNANCFGERGWDYAVSDIWALASGDCGLQDGSDPFDWRLPNKKELISLIHDGVFNPALPNTAGTGKWAEGDPFNNVQSSEYWTSTKMSYNNLEQWYVDMYQGVVEKDIMENNRYVWPVRGGH